MNHQTFRDIRALLRYAWLDSRFGVIAMLALSVLGVVICQTLDDSIDQIMRLNERATLRSVVMVLTQFPLLLYATIAFGHSAASLERCTDSGYDPLLLRMPVSNAVLIMTPLITRWLYIAIAVLLALATYGTPWSPWYWDLWLSLWISLASASTLVSGLVWRPSRRFWIRGASCLAVFPIAYILVALSFGFEELQSWPWLYVGPVPSPGLILFIGAVGLCIHSVPLARTSRSVSPIVEQRLADSAAPVVEKVIGISMESMTVPQALRWWNVQRLPKLLWWMKGVVLIAMLLAFITAPLAIGVMFAQLFMLCVVVNIGGGGWGFTLGQSGKKRRTPDWLAVSAVSLNRLAGEKVRRSILGSIGVTMFLVVWWSGVAILPSGQAAWRSWASELSWVDTDERSTGLRVSLAIGIAAIALAVGRSLAILWLDLLANERVTIAVTLVLVTAWVFGIGLAFRWFFRQTDWEGVRQGWNHFLQWIPSLMIATCMLKLAAIAVAVVVALRQPGDGRYWTMRVLSVWLVTVGAVSLALVGLLPANLNLPPAVGEWPWIPAIVASVAVTFPLTRILILPWAIAQDIHR